MTTDTFSEYGKPRTTASTREVINQDRPIDHRIIVWDTRPFYRAREKYVPIWVDVAKLEAMLRLSGNHVRFAGENGIMGKYAGVDKFIRSRKRRRILMPLVRMEPYQRNPDQKIVCLFDGRHRFAWMRDHDALQLPVGALDRDASEVNRLVGTDWRHTIVTMQEIPEFDWLGTED